MVTLRLPQQHSTGVPSVWLRIARYLVLFPDNPRTGAWGRGSSLAFRTATQQHKRVFVVTGIPPVGTRHTRVIPALLFAVVSGYLVVPANAAVTHAA